MGLPFLSYFPFLPFLPSGRFSMSEMLEENLGPFFILFSSPFSSLGPIFYGSKHELGPNMTIPQECVHKQGGRGPRQSLPLFLYMYNMYRYFSPVIE